MEKELKYVLMGAPFVAAALLILYGIKTGNSAYFTLGIGVVISALVKLDDGVIDQGESFMIFSALMAGLKMIKGKKREKDNATSDKSQSRTCSTSYPSETTVSLSGDSRRSVDSESSD